jgi:HPr serine kinase-like protein
VNRYRFHDLTIDVRCCERETARDLDQLLHELLWTRAPRSADTPSLTLSASRKDGAKSLPAQAQTFFQTDGVRGLRDGRDFYLTDEDSLFHLDPRRGHGEASLADSFFLKPISSRQRFWSFGLLKLLRPMGIYALHAAALVAENGLGILLVGESGTGKSTLAIGLIRAGWRYLSDEAVLLRSRSGRVEALALRKHFYVDDSASEQHADLLSQEQRPDRSGRMRRRVAIEEAYPGQRMAVSEPRLLLFPQIVRQSRSALLPITQARAVELLVAQSGPQLFDQETIAQQLATLKELLQQTTAYELRAGSDLHDDPTTLIELLAATEGEKSCLA